MIEELNIRIVRAINGYIVHTSLEDTEDSSTNAFITEDLNEAMLHVNRFVQHGHVRLANENDQESL